jgi:hypothetical protein
MLIAALAACGLAAAAPAHARVARPTPTAPAAGATLQSAPSFVWTRVRRTDRYEFQISGAALNGSALAGQTDFYTRNTRATLTKAIPNGSYAWRVRALGVDGSVSGWTAWRRFNKKWTGRPVLQSPLAGGRLTFPTKPVVLRWSAVPSAAQYLVSVATDPLLSSLVLHYQNQDDPNGPPNVAATSAAVAAPLPAGAYYWGVTAVDAEGDHGVPSAVHSFNWAWPAFTTPTVTDLDPAPEVFDPKFSWAPVSGAARYEVEVNSSVDFAPGSKVCCSGTTLATSLSPDKVLKNDTYYWRVRAIDPDGDAGPWNVGPAFKKTFDNAPPVTAPSVKNLHMRDNLTDPAGFQTQAPVVTWSSVPGASSYEVDVAPYVSGICNWTARPTEGHWRVQTAVNAWTPLGDRWNGVKPYSDPLAVGNDLGIPLAPGPYCVRVRARSDRDTAGQEVYGDYTYLDHGVPGGPAFQFTGPAPPPLFPPDCSSGSRYPGSADYVTPRSGTLTRRTPYFTWRAIPGAKSYFVLVSKDSNFTSIVDYGFTHIPAYAPRTSLAPRTYTDETTAYYWAVLPALCFDGSFALGNPLYASPPHFQKQSVPPALISPASGHVFRDQPTFQWTPAEGARRYELQVATDAKFSNLLDDVSTDATSYSSNTTYPADTILYWRVRADDENLVGLRWSATGEFQKMLPAPVPSPGNPRAGEKLPVWTWSPVQGASSYDLTLDGPGGFHRYFSGFRSPAASFIKMTGLGVWHWRVRAEFPRSSWGQTPGPYSATQSFTRFITAPGRPRTDDGHNHVLLRWDSHLGAAHYAVQIASSWDFSRILEQSTTDNTSYAPTMTGYGYRAGGPLYWRVAAQDSDRNQGSWTKPQRIGLQPRMIVSVFGTARRKAKCKLLFSAATATGQPLRGVRVRLTGAGISPRSRRTHSTGHVTFKVRPRRNGKLIFTATKRGFQTEYAVVAVQ